MPERLDLRGVPCPANAAKALMKIATMSHGEELEVVIDAGEPLENLPPAMEEAGHKIVSRADAGEGAWAVVIQVNER